MKVVFDQSYYTVYTSDPAAEPGRMQAIVKALPTNTTFVEPKPVTYEQINLAHTAEHIRIIQEQELYDMAALAAGGAITAARIGLSEPAFGLIRPPGHHASVDAAWGFCFFNNMAVALLTLKADQQIQSAYVLDIDLHYGDGTVNILGDADWVSILNPAKNSRTAYIAEVENALASVNSDIIGISAGFDNHLEDWGGLLATEDYFTIGRLVRDRAKQTNGGCFALLEGGYNHSVLGQNVTALINGMSQ
ncbi:MAG TPA: histone deacetylase family protein [Desulfosalsimonadaceae bacterium]|nr:histone deacetylase family protein [Desulfosalsimonadaceae bacterium]